MHNTFNELIICFESQTSEPLYAEESVICKDYKSQKRIDEFQRGRIAAKNALSKLGIKNFPILKSSSGSPIWPEEIRGSISHSKDIAVAVVSKKLFYIGVDLEYQKQERNPEIFKKICSETEYNWVKQDSKLRGLKIFSAKEAIYKAFFSVAKLGFHDVELSWQDSYFNCILTRDLNEKFKNGFSFRCDQIQEKNQILMHQNYIFSVVAL